MITSDKNNSAEDWAKAVHVMDVLRVREGGRQLSDPSLVVQSTTRNVFLTDGPTEVFSQAMPTPEKLDDDELMPIDVLYGRYVPGTRRVEIFINRIEQDAPRFNCEPSDLLTIVRIHEYAHAVCHIGIPVQDIQECLSANSGTPETDWATFGIERERSFRSLDTASHELIAQALTWYCINKFWSTTESSRLMDAFRALEAHQATEYQLSQSLKDATLRTNWRLIIDAVHGVVDCFGGTNFEMREGLAALIQKTAEQAAEADR
jgi:hypothetical protein